MKRFCLLKTTKPLFWAFLCFILLSARLIASDFPADAASLGEIPDYPVNPSGCHVSGWINKDVTFTVSGLSGAPTNVEIKNLIFNPAHTWGGDITVTLIAPNGTSSIVFGRIGATTATSLGTGADLSGPYGFRNTSDPNIWSVLPTTPIPTNTYTPVVSGGASVSNPPSTINLDTVFAGVTNPNGTWTLRFTDGCNNDTGSVSAVTLTVDTQTVDAFDANVDFNGDGKTDYVVVRTISDQNIWMSNINGIGNTSFIPWGVFFDKFVPEDYDGDGKDDIAVWRQISSGQPNGNAFFYILNSSTNTLSTIDFGQDGDDPTVVGDYDGDNKADAAVYRCPITSGQCYFYYKGTLNNPSGNITFMPWGFGFQGEFFTYPGDFDGDGKYDFCIQRKNPLDNSKSQFVLLKSNGFGIEYINWGLFTDFVVPGDYDGDGKQDFCVRRLSGGQYQYFILTRTGGGTGANPIIWGLFNDTSVPGDYDGDGKTDIAVWRNGAFYVRQSNNNTLLVFNWGQSLDFPVASWYVH